MELGLGPAAVVVDASVVVAACSSDTVAGFQQEMSRHSVWMPRWFELQSRVSKWRGLCSWKMPPIG